MRNLAEAHKSEAHKCIFALKRVKLTGSALEERGRQIRREFFEHLRVKYKARWILTAHTEDDQLETIIFNFLRGSGVAGLAGMNVIDGFYLKPLLSVSKAEILQYLKKRKLRFCRDRTNHDTKLRRVFIRKKILPLLGSINPSFRKTLLRNSSIFRELEKWTLLAAQKFLKRSGAGVGIGAATGIGVGAASAGLPAATSIGSRIFSLKEYELLPSAFKSAVIQEAYRSGQKAAYCLPSVKVAEITRMLERGIGNKKIVCGGGGTFLLKKGDVYFLPTI